MADLDARIAAAQTKLAELLCHRIAEALRSVPAFERAASVSVAAMDRACLVRITGPRGTVLWDYDKPSTPKLTDVMDDPWSVEQDMELLIRLPVARQRLVRTKKHRDYLIRLPKEQAS